MDTSHRVLELDQPLFEEALSHVIKMLGPQLNNQAALIDSPMAQNRLVDRIRQDALQEDPGSFSQVLDENLFKGLAVVEGRHLARLAPFHFRTHKEHVTQAITCIKKACREVTREVFGRHASAASPCGVSSKKFVAPEDVLQ